MADLQMYADHFLNEMLDEAILGVAYEAHRSKTKGTLFLDEDNSDEEKYKIVIENGLDVFGQPISGTSKKNVECLCPNCHRNMAASRFAPHLEKCMGMGRNSSRIASQRIANSGKFASAINESIGTGDDDLDDANDVDWMVACETTSTSKKGKKRKNEKNNGSPRTSRNLLLKARNSPKSDLVNVDQNDNFSNSSVRHNLDLDNLRIENINQTMSSWEKHIHATLSGPETTASNKYNVPGVAPGSGISKRSKSKSTKQSHSKKSKKKVQSSGIS